MMTIDILRVLQIHILDRFLPKIIYCVTNLIKIENLIKLKIIETVDTRYTYY